MAWYSVSIEAVEAILREHFTEAAVRKLVKEITLASFMMDDHKQTKKGEQND